MFEEHALVPSQAHEVSILGRFAAPDAVEVALAPSDPFLEDEVLGSVVDLVGTITGGDAAALAAGESGAARLLGRRRRSRRRCPRRIRAISGRAEGRLRHRRRAEAWLCRGCGGAARAGGAKANRAARSRRIS